MSQIEIHKNSITRLHTEIIVNAANNQLLIGGGVCGAIFSAAGVDQLTSACSAIGHCSVGSAVITPAFRLEETNGIKYIIHAVGPDYRRSLKDPDNALNSCYKAALKLAKENNCHSIGFPLISAGIYACPSEKAWMIALSACTDFIVKNSDFDISITFVSTDKAIAEEGKRILSTIQKKPENPVKESSKSSTAKRKSYYDDIHTDSHELFPPDSDDFNVIQDELEELCASVDIEEYPETFKCLKETLETLNVFDKSDLFDLISKLSDCDSTKPIQENVAFFLSTVLYRMSEFGNDEAMLLLGSLYYTGRIGEQNYSTAFEFYKKAADKGNLQAMENLGYCYYYGRSVPVDYEKAYRYFDKCALLGMIPSLYKIGDMYRYGYYVSKDEIEAFRIYNICCDRVSNENVNQCGADVSMRLGDCFFEGIGCKKDLRNAMLYYQQAERLFYDRLYSGDFLIRESLKHVLIMEQQCRIQILVNLPDFEWTK